MKRKAPGFEERTIDQLTIEDERAFSKVPLYADLKAILQRDRYRFRVLPKSKTRSWDRALLLNLTYWTPASGGDVLVDEKLGADVVTHVALHHLASQSLAGKAGAKPTIAELLLGESIASGFDAYLIGTLLDCAPTSSFLVSQVSAMADAAANAGASSKGFESLLQRMANNPSRAFQNLRTLLFDVSSALVACDDAGAALAVLESFALHPFAPMLHHYELSSWVLYARAYGSPRPNRRASAMDSALRTSENAIATLVDAWIDPALR